ncbi:MAG: hypothetical protein IJ736_07495 [Firmicutes bacterium]|nr:hypothetical protein [Bacillota bacterium]
MLQKYNIPLNYKSGKYGLGELSSVSKDSLVLFLKETGVLTYSTPNYKTEVRLYCITENMLKESLAVNYNNEGQLKYIKIIQENGEKLVYINLIDNNSAKNEIFNFCEYNANLISEKLLTYKEKIARIFIERFYDGEAVDISARIGTVDDMNTILEKYDGDLDAVDNSGDYPLDNRIECDNDTLGVILMCSPPEHSDDLFDFAVANITNRIKSRVLELIDKSDDFKFISEEYD